jgi:hypothetical protein
VAGVYLRLAVCGEVLRARCDHTAGQEQCILREGEGSGVCTCTQK